MNMPTCKVSGCKGRLESGFVLCHQHMHEMERAIVVARRKARGASLPATESA